jgi:Cap4 SAVED domain
MSLDLPPIITPEEMAALIRGDESGLDAYLDPLAATTVLKGYDTEVRFHRIAHQATLGTPNLSKLVEKLFLVLVDFCCSRSEAHSAAEEFLRSKSVEAMAKLQEKAKSLFTKSAKTGEPGELLLYLLTERVLGYPQILCKYPHKTSAQVHTHGSDGIHASIDPATGHLRLHWGEAKFYSDWNSALSDALDAISELILQPAESTKKTDRDVQLIRDFIDLNDEALETAICDYMDPDKRLSNTVKFCGVCLIGFNQEKYTELFKGAEADVTSMITSRLKSIEKAVKQRGLAGIRLDFFCIPCESVENFRTYFIKRLGV